MNRVSPFWTKEVEVTAQRGEIVFIRCEGFVFRTDGKNSEKEAEVAV